MDQPAGDQFNLDDVRVRVARPDDAASLRDLFVEGLIEGKVWAGDSGADLENLQTVYFSDEGASCFWVAEYRGAVIGMIGVLQMGENTAEIRRLRVRHDHRRRGLGSHLMAQAISFCQRQGYLKVVLDVRIERAPAIAMFRKWGFQLARSRNVGERTLLDFYLDLYRDPST
jgi:ribosomal protein S18 acetylase RimI-like enzyme